MLTQRFSLFHEVRPELDLLLLRRRDVLDDIIEFDLASVSRHLKIRKKRAPGRSGFTHFVALDQLGRGIPLVHHLVLDRPLGLVPDRDLLPIEGDQLTELVIVRQYGQRRDNLRSDSRDSIAVERLESGLEGGDHAGERGGESRHGLSVELLEGGYQTRQSDRRHLGGEGTVEAIESIDRFAAHKTYPREKLPVCPYEE